MRKLLILILLAGVGYWAYQRHASSSGTRLSFPATVAWRHISGSPQFIETAAVLDGRWRVEITGGRSPIIAVFDGHSFASTHPKATVQELDPIAHMQEIYANLHSTAGIPIERLGSIDCWHFSQTPSAAVVDVWIDTKTRFLRKASGRINGSDLNDTYELLPLDVEAEAKQLFDTKNLRLLLSR